MEYDFVPLPHRKPLIWPNGARVALVMTFNLETWDLTKPTKEKYYAGGPAVLPDVLAGDTPDFPNYTWREYGQRVGIWRLFDLFDEQGVKASCTTNAVTFERRKAMTDACLERGWELLAHNWEQGELLTDFAHEPAKERDIVLRSLEQYEKFVGKRAKGWLSSSLRGTLQTADILAEHGCTFYCDLLNDDQPYLLRTPSGPIVSTPYSNEINDFTLLTRRGHTTDEYRDVLIEELNVLYKEGATSGRLMNVGIHPHVSGRAYRIRALREFIQHAKSLPGVWFATREEIADWYLQNHESHIPTGATAKAAE
ncbi:polysaccharide deacetylase [Caulobacter flavus]|jgi:allantoinase|uniref:Polysaccharide deacetylase n=1 Tax=Caulobacter flavus TaxID=1679497 RepID=A0A2N5CPF5_9CAUL|nr:polysaccharide deacetylase family protein [Caulobacter flavus]AYV48452.1 polysaccharide deacetylase [Caulobacter flavus]PLR08832.1 polysaccharide deacetylase [Caulobacter flavus]